MRLRTQRRWKNLGFFTAGILCGIIIFTIFYWHPVIDRFVNWCTYYPHSLADCREDVKE